MIVEKARTDPNPQEAMQDLRRLNARFIENFINNDVTSHDAMLQKDFIYVRSNGGRVDRASYLEGWATGFDPDFITYWDVRDEFITIAGNVALARAANKEIVQCDGREHIAMTTYTDTYVYENGVWTCIQAQITPIAPEHEPGDDTIISVYIRGVRQSGTRSASKR